MDFITKALTYAFRSVLFWNFKVVAYEDRRLLLFFVAISVVFPAFVIKQGILNRSYMSHVNTDYLFNIGSAQTMVEVDDMIVGEHAGYTLESLAVKETDSVILVPTRVRSALEEYGDCQMDAMNPGVPCSSDIECMDYYNQSDSRCDTSRMACDFRPYTGWCSRNVSDTSLFSARNLLDLTVTARIMCADYRIFSNFNRFDKKQQHYYFLRSYDLLKMSNLHTSADYSEYFGRGVAFLVTYSWMCDIDRKLGRYDCPLHQTVKVLSNTSIISSRTEVYLSRAGPNGQMATRQVQTIIGFRFMFVGRGGCYQTTTLSVLSFMASLFALNSLVGLAMAAVIISWKLWYGAPVFGEVYRLASRGMGKRPRAVLHNNSRMDTDKSASMCVYNDDDNDASNGGSSLELPVTSGEEERRGSAASCDSEVVLVERS